MIKGGDLARCIVSNGLFNQTTGVLASRLDNKEAGGLQMGTMGYRNSKPGARRRWREL